ncbi:MAG: tRNA (N(6)-L-threonylcarbamoyladenosine(37)-C(2))-methylthiotransferase MtaB [Candidatus Polarisedimenticolaceae bacterium]|nr:tRNA (N(6)-L-threonylcarbamoyladenosine(37)-C(2))-methylthiotransferase MtaB [Candidatus Polarisedimenticolaceae bacterium]
MFVHLKTLGCRLNEAEMESWSREFHQRGHQLTRDPKQADLVVVNTCAVTEEAVRKSRRLIRQAHSKNPNAKLVISGCYASLNPAESFKAVGVDLVVSNQDKEQLVEIVSRELDLNVMPEMATESGDLTLLPRNRQRAFIKVQDGCRYQCTFCIVTKARGDERSRSLPSIIEEINWRHAEGVNEVVLAGVHLGGYGSDIGSDLSELIRTVLDETTIPRVRIGSLEPWDLPDDFPELFKNPRFMPHLHLPLQSGADSVLQRMARRCKVAEYRKLVNDLRQVVPELNITTDIIVGFPGESDQEWQQSLQTVEAIGFGHIHIFAYSPRDGTIAATLANPVSRECKRQRSQTLHELGEQLKQQQLRDAIGKQSRLLVENHSDESGQSYWQGYTPNFLRAELAAPADAGLKNTIIDIEITGVSDDGERLQVKRLLNCNYSAPLKRSL